jgi:hypothetical protein
LKYLKLKNGYGSFVDLETGLRIKGDMVIPMPNKIGSLTQQWISGGGIVIETVEDTPDVVEIKSPDVIDDLPESVEPQKDVVNNAEIESMTWVDLKRACRAAGVRATLSDKRPDLERKLRGARSRR